MWRTLFIVTIAVPQFVSLLLVRNFFANGGIVNTFCSNIGLTDFLRYWTYFHKLCAVFISSRLGACNDYFNQYLDWCAVSDADLHSVLMNLPSDQLESARVDGATSFQIFRKITMPYFFCL